MLKILKRLKLPDTRAGKILQGIGAVVGIGGISATSIGMFELTGDTTVDMTIILCTTAIILFGGKVQIPEQYEKELEKDD